MTSFRLRNRPDGAVSLQIHYNDLWRTIVIFYRNGKIMRSGGLPQECGLQVDGQGRIRHA